MAAWEPLTGQTSRSLIKALQSFSRTASTFVVLVGVAVLVGWVFNIDIFKSVLPGSVAMKVNTALGLIFGGTSLRLWHRQPTSRLTRLLGQVCAVGVLLIGLLTLIEYSFSVDLGIDQAWIKTPLDPLGDAAPGRMAVHTAFNFLLLGIDLLLLNRRRSSLPTQLIASVVFLIALLGMLGYLFGNAVFYRIGSPTSMAVHTSVAFFLLSLGILFARPQQGAAAIFTQMDAGGISARRLIPAAIVIPPLVCWVLLLGSRSKIYTPELGICLLSILLVIVFTLLVSANARLLGRFEQQRRKLQESLQQANEALEQRVEERTLQLQQVNKQLQTEIAERQAVEAELQDTLQKLNFHVENSPLGVVEWDRDFGVTRWSREAEQIFGWQSEEVVGKRLSDWQFVHTADQEIVEAAITSFLLGNTPQLMVQNRNYAKDGSIVHCEWYNSALSDEAGNLVSVLSLVLDVSDRVRLEAERTNAVEENLRLFQQEQAARATAEQANRLKDEFLAVLSHELRTPMNPILGWSQLLRQGKLNSTKTAHALETIERNAQLQVQLIDDLLDIPRLVQGKLSLEIAPVNLTIIISAALETVRLAAEAKSLSIQTTFPPSATVVSGDAGRLQQVVWNLLSNAVKFTPSGGQINIELAQVGANAQIQVKDSGKGINLEFLPYVFDHFRQEDGATTRKFGGLGLGLAITRQIVELHGGTVAVDSPGEGQGAVFTVQIPLSPLLVPSPTPSSVSGDLSGIRILVVDDEPDSRDLVAFILQQAGAEVIAVSSAIEALQTLQTTQLDLLLSDIGMPGIDGYELMRQICQSREPSGHPPAIALTAYAGEVNQQQALAAGFQGHITKPVEPDELIKTLVTLMGRNQTT